MSRHGPAVTVTLRKVSTGYKILAFYTEDMNGAYAMAQVLIASPSYNRCYAVATGWEGNVLFEVRGASQAHPQAVVPQMQAYVPSPQYVEQRQEYRAVLPPLQLSPAPRMPRQDSYGPEPQMVDSGYGVRMLPSGGQRR